MSTFKHLHVSLEGIEFQNGAFFKELVLTLSQFPQAQRASLNATDYGKLSIGIDKCVKKHSGLVIDTKFEDFDLNGYISTPVIDLNNPLWVEMNRQYAPGTKGVDWFVEKHSSGVSIDRSTGKVSGALSKMKFTLGLPKLTYINGKLNNEQFCGIILHELGHLFSMFEFLDKSMSTNIVLNELDRQLRSNPDPKTREAIIDKSGKALGFERTVIVDAAKSSDDKVVLTLFIGNAIENIRSETGSSWFDMNTWETVADQYAVRQGAGAAFSQALEIMYHGDYASSAQTTKQYLITESLKLIRQVIFSIGGTGALVGGAVGMAVATSGGTILGFAALAFIGYLAVAISSVWLDGNQSGESGPTYATAFTRLQRVRQQMVLRAKQLSLEIRPSQVQGQLLQDVALIDEVMKNFHDRQSWLDTIAAFLSTPVRNKQVNIKFQKELESIALNDLYLQGLSLKNL